MEVIVPDDQLSLAIGKRGQNRALASRLVGWKIDVKSESKYSKSLKEGYLSLLSIPGVGEITASLLDEAGYSSAREVAETSWEELTQSTGLTEKKAATLIAAAREMASRAGRKPRPMRLRTKPRFRKVEGMFYRAEGEISIGG